MLKETIRAKNLPTLQEQVARAHNQAMQKSVTMQTAQTQALSDYVDFLEECLVEMATLLYSME